MQDPPKKNRSNLVAPRTIKSPCDLSDLNTWFTREIEATEEQQPYRDILQIVVKNFNDFVKWPRQAILVWKGRTRKTKYHSYPNELKLIALHQEIKLASGIRLDGRSNGPALLAFQIAEGIRPQRSGSNNAWSIHHVYSGKFPFPGRPDTTHAAQDGLHCTQSAGLVAVHPIADQLCDEFPAFTWLLRARAYDLFGYDPDQVFSNELHDEFGFTGKKCTVIPIENDNA